MANLDPRFGPNSLLAVEACARANVPRLEIDVRFLADDAMLVFHDPVFERLTTLAGVVGQSDRGHASAARLLAFPDGALCFLEDAVAALKHCDTVLHVDLKAGGLLKPRQASALREALSPLGSRALLGTMGHWNLRLLAGSGMRLAFDPTRHLHFASDAGDGRRMPHTLGKFGLWDDSPAAELLDGSFEEYLSTRIDDLVALVPGVCEWMVDIGTLLYCDDQGVPMGDRLAERGIELAAWTMRDVNAEENVYAMRRLFGLGVTTIITDDAEALAGHARSI